MKGTRKIIYYLYAILVGAGFGLFMGLIILSTFLRLLVHWMFNWGDSGPYWVNWLIDLITLLSVFICTVISVKWMHTYTARQKK